MSGRLSPADLLAAWDAGAPRAPLDRALVLLWAAGAPSEGLAAMALEERDRRLLALRAATFGDILPCRTACPTCGEAVELDLSAATLAAALPDPAAEVLAVGGLELVLRSPDSRDLAAAAACGDAAAAEAVLFERLVGSDLAPDERAAVAGRIEARAEAAEIVLALDCPGCGHGWAEVLDVARFVWAEVEAAALRLMGEVAEIARVFHWSEAAILAMSPPRRRAYLTLARGS